MNWYTKRSRATICVVACTIVREMFGKIWIMYHRDADEDERHAVETPVQHFEVLDAQELHLPRLRLCVGRCGASVWSNKSQPTETSCAPIGVTGTGLSLLPVAGCETVCCRLSSQSATCASDGANSAAGDAACTL